MTSPIIAVTGAGAGARRSMRARAGSIVRKRPGVVGAVVAGAAGLAVVGLLRNMTSMDIPDPFKGQDFQFPNDLNSFGNYMEFRAYPTNGILSGQLSSIFSSLGLGALSTNFVGTDGAAIRLPLPNNLKVDYDPQYDTPSLGATAQAQLLKAADRSVYGNTQIPGGNVASATGIAALGQLAGQIASRIPGLGAAAGAAGLTGTDAQAALKVGAGLALNPHKIVLFTGVDFRNHQFSWRLSPRNKTESDTINQICQAFTYYAHPNFESGGLFLKYPEFFAIRIIRDNYLNKFLPCVLDSISIDYQPMGYTAYKRGDFNQNDPAPAEVQLSLSFKETEIITKEALVFPERNIRPQVPVATQRTNPGQATQPIGQVPGTNIPTDTFFGAP